MLRIALGTIGLVGVLLLSGCELKYVFKGEVWHVADQFGQEVIPSCDDLKGQFKEHQEAFKLLEKEVAALVAAANVDGDETVNTAELHKHLQRINDLVLHLKNFLDESLFRMDYTIYERWRISKRTLERKLKRFVDWQYYSGQPKVRIHLKSAMFLGDPHDMVVVPEVAEFKKEFVVSSARRISPLGYCVARKGFLIDADIIAEWNGETRVVKTHFMSR